MLGFILLAYVSNKQNQKIEVIIYISLALLFQPFIKVALGRNAWNIVDLIVSAGLIISLFIKPKKYTWANAPSQAHLQGTQSRRTKANLAKEPALCQRTGHTLRCDTDPHYRWPRRKGERTTWVLLQVGLDVETSAVCIAVLLFRQTSFNLAFCC